MQRLRMIGGAVSALVLGALSVGMASPATAAGPLPILDPGPGGGVSSVTAQPANVLMLQQAGIMAMPSTAGGTVGVVANTGTAGVTFGGAIETLGVGLAAAFGLSQLFGLSDGTKVQADGATLGSDGLGGVRLDVKTDPPGAVPSKDYTNAIGTESWSNAAHTGGRSWITTSYDYGASDPHRRYCVASSVSMSGQSLTATYAGGSTYSIGWSSSAGADCPAVGGAQYYTTFRATNTGSGFPAVVSFKGASSWVSSNTIPGPVVTQMATDGVLKMHTWCADPVNPGGPLVDYMTAQIASLKAGQSVNLADAKCPSGKAAADASIDWTPNGGSTTTVLPPRGDAAVRADPAIAANIARPECASGTCLLVLTHTDGRPCGAVGEQCPDWAKDPNYAQNYKCTFGGTAVGINSCSVYRDPSKGIQPNTKIDGSPYTPTDPATNPGGRVVSDPSKAPNPDGTKPAPAPVGDTVTSQDPNNCRTASWIENLNPFTMFTTIGCALKDAFVPDPVKVQTAVTTVKDSWSQTPPVKVSVMVNSITGALPAGSGCSGISFTFPGVLGVAAQNFTVLNACSEPVAGVALIVRIIGAIGMIIFGILALTKMAGGVIALPGLGKTGGDS